MTFDNTKCQSLICWLCFVFCLFLFILYLLHQRGCFSVLVPTVPFIPLLPGDGDGGAILLSCFGSAMADSHSVLCSEP